MKSAKKTNIILTCCLLFNVLSVSAFSFRPYFQHCSRLFQPIMQVMQRHGKAIGVFAGSFGLTLGLAYLAKKSNLFQKTVTRSRLEAERLQNNSLKFMNLFRKILRGRRSIQQPAPDNRTPFEVMQANLNNTNPEEFMQAVDAYTQSIDNISSAEWQSRVDRDANTKMLRGVADRLGTLLTWFGPAEKFMTDLNNVGIENSEQLAGFIRQCGARPNDSYATIKQILDTKWNEINDKHPLYLKVREVRGLFRDQFGFECYKNIRDGKINDFTRQQQAQYPGMLDRIMRKDSDKNVLLLKIQGQEVL